ncbi:MAG: F0F1 ATP synthase subunit gamma, partial [Duncaniella sp.]|nr:F0F1 ATP synthase subunit gamma [Duncaniella sp.]
MATLRELKGRIGSVASSEKITGAMKMISSAKMHKAEQALKQLRPFRDQVETIMANLAASDAAMSSPLMEERQVGRAVIVVWGSDDGLCGAYNVNVFKQLLDKIDELRAKLGPEARITVMPVGRKMGAACRKLKMHNVDCQIPQGIDSKSGGDKVRDFVWRLRDMFLSGEADLVEAVYMSFKSISRQRLEAVTLLPVGTDVMAGSHQASGRPYIFEPSAEAIFRQILPMYLLALGQDIFTENQASEQA